MLRKARVISGRLVAVLRNRCSVSNAFSTRISHSTIYSSIAISLFGWPFKIRPPVEHAPPGAVQPSASANSGTSEDDMNLLDPIQNEALRVHIFFSKTNGSWPSNGV